VYFDGFSNYFLIACQQRTGLFVFPKKGRFEPSKRVRRSGRKERLSDRGVSSSAAFSKFADQRTEKARERRVSLHLRQKKKTCPIRRGVIRK
jgi:hypothetical protein